VKRAPPAADEGNDGEKGDQEQQWVDDDATGDRDDQQDDGQ
jgi:hypothetical protein